MPVHLPRSPHLSRWGQVILIYFIPAILNTGQLLKGLRGGDVGRAVRRKGEEP